MVLRFIRRISCLERCAVPQALLLVLKTSERCAINITQNPANRSESSCDHFFHLNACFYFGGAAPNATLSFIMTSFVQYILIVGTILFISSSIALPGLPLMNISSNSTLATLDTQQLNNAYQCYEPHLVSKDRRAKTLDCIRAAAFLPNLHETGDFTRDSDPDDPFAMPHEVIYGTCRVNVDVRFGRPDESSWTVINIALRKVIDACRIKVGGEWTGGDTTAGSDGRIIIRAENKNWRSTNVASEKRTIL